MAAPFKIGFDYPRSRAKRVYGFFGIKGGGGVFGGHHKENIQIFRLSIQKAIDNFGLLINNQWTPVDFSWIIHKYLWIIHDTDVFRLLLKIIIQIYNPETFTDSP